MNSVELKGKLLEMFLDYISNKENKIMDVYTCFYMAVIDEIMRQYMTRRDYMEEDALKTMEIFLKKGILSW